MDRHIYTMKRPASCFGEQWREAMPLGNGLTGALIPGAIAEERIQFNRFDLWHHGDPGNAVPDVSDVFAEMRRSMDAGDYAAANQDNLRTALMERGYHCGMECPAPMGWLNISFAPGSVFRRYRRGVNMRTAEAFVEFELEGCLHRRQMFISRADDIAVLRLCAGRPFTVRYSFDFFAGAGQCSFEADGFTAAAADGGSAVNVRVSGDCTAVVKGGALEVTGTEQLVLVRCASRGSALSLEEFAGQSYEMLLQRHTALHTPLYDAVNIELAPDADHARSNESLLDEAYDGQASPALIERLWRFGRYLFISAAAENGNPVPLYGLWHGADDLPWCQFVANENVEMTYWHTLAGGLSYAMPALLRHYMNKLPDFRECARKIFGMRGIWISAYTTPNVGGACIPVTVIVNWISCAGWLSRHFWEYYLYTGDEQLLRQQILPFMYETALFYQDYAVLKEGRVRLYPSVSPENTPSNLMGADTYSASGHNCPAVENAVMDLAVMKELLTNLLDGIARTGMYADEAGDFRALRDAIPAYTVNEDGAVKEWVHPQLKDNYHHRHLSHIYPVFPGCEVTASRDPQLFEAFRRAVQLRVLGSQSGWSLTHMANIYARFGEAEKAAECLDIMAKSVVHPSLLTVHNDWRHMGMTLDWKEASVQLDAAFGAVSAVQEMLFRWQTDALAVLPALPARLAAGCVQGICFPGGTADIRWQTDAVSVTVHAARPLDTRLQVCGTDCGAVKLAAGESRTWQLSR